MSDKIVYTIGHSTLSYERFLTLLRKADVTAVADVRSAPYSRHFPHFSQDLLKSELQMDGIAYSFLGKELGGRPSGSQYFCEGVADYESMAKAPEFHEGLKRVMDGSVKYRIALMCSERDPLDCHRCLLVGRALSEQGVVVKHILPDGNAIDQEGIEQRLLKSNDQQEMDLGNGNRTKLADAYRARARRVAYAEQPQSAQRRTAAS
ncbi:MULTISPECIES: DUF488 family protein [unclassified Mesorhizobium]|uniref:DUF488 domain-containing protein n=1 Tax=unclassified Mesorhizobium TaxID=325217 RepID=UPI00112DC0AF|nr:MULTISPECIES: DUF488 domain-containing protein [unclassified Mesorhizobium]MCA0000066.1 DUF488 domain-containing protein [Mesorhizobium sp. B264B2A]MCA0006117.1 DUF488 domain-containing protein [Mesorhizobium sp. B264B1B]MCA0022413.1 DUF488 domain-containing protein [Mesorhizobium sp. B264B1A]TPJ48682.1 DUF488 domain-containing protein [Mesorhizobium sp. B2-6-6]